jgi:hypothetical protein
LYEKVKGLADQGEKKERKKVKVVANKGKKE